MGLSWLGSGRMIWLLVFLLPFSVMFQAYVLLMGVDLTAMRPTMLVQFGIRTFDVVFGTWVPSRTDMTGAEFGVVD